MVKRTLALVVSAIATSTVFVGCTDYSEFTEGQLNNLYNQKEYGEAFVKEFGTIDPNHDWGMNEEIGASAGSTMMTRGGGTDPDKNPTAARVELNRNMWTMYKSLNEVKFPDYGTGVPTVSVPVYTDIEGEQGFDAIGKDYIIPGFPHLNGLYYISKGNIEDNYYSADEITPGMVPCGDVTPYEIQYVSNWFRTHKNPQSNVKLHLSEFFIQNISCDNDQIEYKESGYSTYKDWPSTGNNGSNITTKQQAINNNTSEKGGYVGKEENSHTDKYVENLTEDINYSLDHLCFKDMDGNWFHVNDFNGGNSNFSPEDKDSNPNREIKFVRSSGTEDFRCRPSWGTGDQGDDCDDESYINSWVLVRLTWNETVKHPKSPYYQLGTTTIPREGYYLAFDFHAKKNNGSEVVNRDGYYSNWIVKITPAHFNSSGRARRVFCEDLGGSLDFDFNDAVVDVAFEKVTGGYQPIISVQAAGGTMPIYIERNTNDERYEMHHMLESETTEAVNVIKDATPKAPAIYRSNNIYQKTNAGQISIIVKNSKNGETYNINGQGADSNDDERTPSMPENNMDYYYNTKDNAPRAFSAPINVKWSLELNNISNGYKDFTNWVKDKNWTTSGTNAKWYKNVTAEAKNLYTSPFVPEIDFPTGGGTDGGVQWDDLIPAADVAELVSKVNADSYMKLNDYTGDDGILDNLSSKGDDARVTFVVVLSSKDSYNLNDDDPKLSACLIPADIEQKTNDDSSVTYSMSYKGKTFTPAGIDSNKRFNPADYVDVNNNGDSWAESEHTYALQFSFSKSDLKKSNGDFHDFLLLFLKVGDNAVATGNHGITIRKWYAHY